jgi:Fe-S-cluster-containing dehydrogenase component
MVKRRIVITFPQDLLDKPVTYHLIKDHNLIVNILKAQVTPKEQGQLVLELEGKKHDLESGLSYLRKSGLKIQSLANDVTWDKQKCTHCTECVSVCPTNAFIIDRRTMEVSFDADKCIACGLCVDVCPYRAVEIVI